VVLVYDPATQRQTYTRSLVFGLRSGVQSLEDFKNPFALIGVDPNPVVLEHNMDAIGILKVGGENVDLWCSVEVAILDRVRQKVFKQQPQLNLITPRLAQVANLNVRASIRHLLGK
jgi:hypothetical protein